MATHKRKPPQTHHLDDDYIRSRARPAKGNVIDFDDQINGFAVRFTPKGTPTFLYCYGSSLAGGSARRMVIGRWTPDSGLSASSVMPAMRKLAKSYRGQVDNGRDPYKERQEAVDERKAAEAERKAAQRREEAEVTVDELCDLYLAEHGPKLRPATKRKTELRMARYLRPVWGERKAKDITKADVIALLKPVRAAGKRCEVVHMLSMVTGLFNFAVDDDELEAITDNPARGLKKKLITKNERPPARDRALTTQREFRAFYLVTQPGIYKGQVMGKDKAMHPDEAACLRLMMLTGCRPSEAAGLPWSEVDMFAKVWNKPADVPGRSKSRRADVVPLVDEAMAILQARRGNGSDFVFPAQRGMGKKPLTENRLAGALRGVGHRLARMGIEPWTPHDLRRTVTTGLYEIDVDTYLVKRTLNHATTGVTDTHYNKHTFMRQRRAALEGWAAYLEQTTRGTRPDVPDNVVPFAKVGGR
ncbi:tyrosine-type recombinase/integrase [Novilysobacter erysipheiresistens]|uniref:Tyrosine-type recombinase/integrase n=1 Tax=Novilysobacter erysipheiresistens TaxID=1749332 RepID=A0ABU7YUT2_9GAMM